MKTVIKIDFREDDNYFENEWDENTDPNLLIIALVLVIIALVVFANTFKKL